MINTDQYVFFFHHTTANIYVVKKCLFFCSGIEECIYALTSEPLFETKRAFLCTVSDSQY